MNQREASKSNFSLFAELPTIEEINAGSLQRIADATEIMAKEYYKLLSDRDFYVRKFKEEYAQTKRLLRRIRALKGVITKMKRREV